MAGLGRRGAKDRRARKTEYADAICAGLIKEHAASGNPAAGGFVRRLPRSRFAQGLDGRRRQRPGRPRCEGAAAQHVGKAIVLRSSCCMGLFPVAWQSSRCRLSRRPFQRPFVATHPQIRTNALTYPADLLRERAQDRVVAITAHQHVADAPL